MTLTEVQNRLTEIASISLQELEDDAVLALLKERKELLAEEARIQQAMEQEKKEREAEQEKAARLEAERKAKESEAKKAELLARLAEVNKGITPDQDDEKLMALIQERKVVEAELNVLAAVPSETPAETPAPVPEVAEPKVFSEPSEKIVLEVPESVVPAPIEEVSEENEVPQEKESKDVLPSENISITNTPHSPSSHISKSGKVSGLERLSDNRIAVDSGIQSGEFQGYLSELKANLNSLGTFLQALPIAVKRNRGFMLEVANIDPAYAMHYADKDTLKKDESFNVAIAGMNNQRNTGNPLSEMLPEMRTGAVVLAGVKNDFRNVRFVRPEMPEYNEIITLAKKGALEAAKSLHGAHDIQFLIPPVLQKDKAFMAEVEKMIQ